MAGLSTLEAFLRAYSSTEDPQRLAVVETIRALARASRQIRDVVSQGQLGGDIGAARGSTNADGDRQRFLDVRADEIVLAEMREAPVAAYASEEIGSPILLNPEGVLAVATDPLDGSSNIDTNVSIGTIFSILPHAPNAADGVGTDFAQPGRNQLAAGFFIYGPQLAMVLTVGEGTHVFVYSHRIGGYQQILDGVLISPNTNEFAINMSNYRHWDEAVRIYIDDCLQGSAGPRARDFNMRWIASLVADTYRIIARGGVFLYPRDNRRGYGEGRLRLVYEANPIAMLIEQAGGLATDGGFPILDQIPASLHQRTPFIFGSKKEVERILRYHEAPSLIGERAPLFTHRGLFRV
ncbi:class 1 fructose-bisphosphatase [Afifella marina]|uniref:Fructose-1,6-bisphosphatase class 1 n=1 Tax=Afifella marina DSM 2698 TaxID=1120955 RepID=A0A1G5ML32_AFIMA|nr:class 1 fructose-bisphosphatase [Afifella marina]MBK1623810.1 class 1 fructose-bisphosphatase [Afifella marina DSM 2698]MBK1627274.1 class 1 fructose-bisphosphatase [Afifella marina]MBK5918697.1 fructose-bisphosphatase class I [Afifella marina]RAI22688.1 fructose-bisphosphatase class I [Afifella marina DSM 2698]SCZ25351.1 fructose-1,6-bisphosphatase I [Afifella marina DSM 2698]